MRKCPVELQFYEVFNFRVMGCAIPYVIEKYSGQLQSYALTHPTRCAGNVGDLAQALVTGVASHGYAGFRAVLRH